MSRYFDQKLLNRIEVAAKTKDWKSILGWNQIMCIKGEPAESLAIWLIRFVREIREDRIRIRKAFILGLTIGLSCSMFILWR